MALLKIESLSAFYGDVPALKDINIEIKEGEIVAIVGSNGAGKTTLLKSISGLIKEIRGNIFFEDQDITRLKTEKIIEKRVIHVPEGRRLFPQMSVEENLLMGAYSRKDNGIDNDMNTVYSLFPVLKERSGQAAGTLSGGEQQMLAMAKGLMGAPKLLLIDEMSLGLAPKIVDDLIDIVLKLNKEGKTILLVEQDVRLALENSTYGYILESGRITLEGESSDLLNDQGVKKAYLGI